MSDPSIIPRGQDPGPITEPERSLSARLDTALHTLLGNRYNSLPVKWAVIRGVDDASPWAGVYGIDLNDKTSVAILVGMLVKRGWTVGWTEGAMLMVHLENHIVKAWPKIDGTPCECITEAFEREAEK